MLPLMEKVYLFPDAHAYANMDYYDITAKVVHKFSDTDKLTAAFFIGNDVCDDAPTESDQRVKNKSTIRKTARRTVGETSPPTFSGRTSKTKMCRSTPTSATAATTTG